MKVEVKLKKNIDGGAINYCVDFNTIDNYLPDSSSYANSQDVINRMIVRFCSRPKVDGWTVRTLANRIRCGSFKLWEIVGIKQILLDYDKHLFSEFCAETKDELEKEQDRRAVEAMAIQREAERENWTESEKKKAMQSIKPVKVDSPSMKLYRYCRENGTVRDLQQHFAKYGISESTFYRMFFDFESKDNRKDIGKRDFAVGKAVRGMGRFYTFEMKGLKYYLDNFMEQFSLMTPMPDVELMRVTSNL